MHRFPLLQCIQTAYVSQFRRQSRSRDDLDPSQALPGPDQVCQWTAFSRLCRLNFKPLATVPGLFHGEQHLSQHDLLAFMRQLHCFQPFPVTP